MRLTARPHTSHFFDEYGFMRLWLEILLWTIGLCLVGYGAFLLITWLDAQNTCSAPYHLVYTGQRLQLVGKVMMWVDQYSCVGN